MLRLLQIKRSDGYNGHCPGHDTSDEAEMHIQRTRRRIAQEQRLTHYDELEARSTMSRLQLAVDDGEHTDASGAALVWRQAARLAGRLHCQARAIADDLEQSR